MTDKLKKVMEKLNSQKSKEKESKTEEKKEEKVEEEKVVDEEEEDKGEDADEETSEEENNEPDKETDKETVIDQQAEDAAILANIDRLQNDGVFRYELLAALLKIDNELKILNYQILKATGGDDEEEKVD